MIENQIKFGNKDREFQVFVKPVGSVCNLSCRYCNYLKKGDRPESCMSDEILEKYIIQHLEASTDQLIMFSWHGGEPAMAGIDFFRKVVRIQQKNILPGRVILNGMQTNGTLLDDEWCEFLAREKFIIGLSLDGPEKFHDLYRSTKNHKPTFREVLKAFELLRKYIIVTEILCVVNAENVKFPGEVYEFFRQMGVMYISFLPLVQPLASGEGRVNSISVPAEAYGNFLCEIFDEWIEKDIGNIKIQIFEEVIRTAFSQDHTLCIFKPICGGVPVIDHNGDFYSCDHFVNSDHLIGNIMETSLSEMLDSEKQHAFGRVKADTLPQYCLRCDVRQMCHGECPKNRFIKTPEGEEGLNYLCAGYKQFFSHCKPFIKSVTEAWHNQNRK